MRVSLFHLVRTVIKKKSKSSVGLSERESEREMDRSYVIRSSRPAGISDSKVREMWSRIKYAIGQIFKKESTSDLSYEKLYR